MRLLNKLSSCPYTSELILGDKKASDITLVELFKLNILCT